MGVTKELARVKKEAVRTALVNEKSNEHRPRPMLPDPARFSGDRKVFRAWKLEVQSKLHVDSASFTNESAKFYYINSLLDGSAKINVSTFVESCTNEGPRRLQVFLFLAYLDGIYGDPGLQARAGDALRNLRQKSGSSFAQFFPMFEKTRADAGGAEWPDSAKKNFLLGTLGQDLND